MVLGLGLGFGFGLRLFGLALGLALNGALLFGIVYSFPIVDQSFYSLFIITIMD
jgi:hypothetical protein